MASIVFDRVREPFRFVVNPSAVIRGNTEIYGGSRRARLRQAGWLSGFYFVNLLLYTLPLTAGGFGVVGGTATPPAYAAFAGAFGADPAATWAFVVALVTNSLYLLAVSAAVFFTFHLGVLLTLSTRGLLQSMHTVAYSTGVYLAAIFTVTWTVQTTDGVEVAREFLLAIQLRFFYLVIDLLGVGLTLPGGRPATVDLTRLSTLGQVMLAAEVVGVAYFLYSMYLGARLNHRASRFESLVAVTFLGLSPVLYVVGSVVFTVVTTGGT